jgi:hypothetical protein
VTILTSSLALADLLNCSDQILPNAFKLDSNLEELVNKVSNRDYDPCNQSVEPAKSKKDLCSKPPRYFQSLLCQKNGKMGFQNKKGLFGLPTGVCWWHSQFHRNATYLAHFAPEKPKLDPSKRKDKRKIKKLLDSIIKMKSLTEIPGYSSLREFTEDPKIEKLLQKRLQMWMGKDSFLKMQWMKGLTIPNNYTSKAEDYFMQQRGYKYDPDKDHGSDKLNAKAQRQFERKTYNSKQKELKAKEKTIEDQQEEINKLFESVNHKNQISFITLQYPGVTAHSQVVFDAKKNIVDGETVYDFKVQDSNYQGDTRESKWGKKSYSQIRFKDGVWYAKSQQGVMNDDYYEPINIKVNYTNQLEKINKLYQQECSKSLF